VILETTVLSLTREPSPVFIPCFPERLKLQLFTFDPFVTEFKLHPRVHENLQKELAE
jgi:hypothetical protein